LADLEKLRPDRTMHLRGFDRYGAAAALHSAAPSAFKVSGAFRDQADFAVLAVWDADNFFEHHSIRHLPDMDFAGMVLAFDVAYDAGLHPLESPRYNWIDWATLDATLEDGTPAQVRLWDNAELLGGAFEPATGTFHLLGDPEPYDRLTVWFQNLAFDYIVPAGSESLTFGLWAHGAGDPHHAVVNGRWYSLYEAENESSAELAERMRLALGADQEITAERADNFLTVCRRPGVDWPVAVQWIDPEPGYEWANGSGTLDKKTLAQVAEALAAQVNAADWVAANSTMAVMAEASGETLGLTAARYGKANVAGQIVSFVSGTRFPGLKPGDPFLLVDPEGSPRTALGYTVQSVDSPTQVTLAESAGAHSAWDFLAPFGGEEGNFVGLYALHKTETLKTQEDAVKLSGGDSDATWRVTLDFSALGLAAVRKLWLTFAPRLQDRHPMQDAEFQASFSNWQVSDPLGKRTLNVAGPGSARIGSRDAWAGYAGPGWAEEKGWYYRGFARHSATAGDSATIHYACAHPHDLWLGTSLYVDRGIVSVSVDGDAATALDCYLPEEPARRARRKLRSALAAGEHDVTITLTGTKNPSSSGYHFYLDYLEAAVPTASLPAPQAQPAFSPATDYDTNHGYNLPPERLAWGIEKLGFQGDLNHYAGVFFLNQRKRTGGSFKAATVTFGGTWAPDDEAYVTISGVTMGKTVFPADTLATIAAHFAYFVNESFVGIWAESSGPTLTIHVRTPVWEFTLATDKQSAGGTIEVSGDLGQGVEGTWEIDAAASPALNRGARDWHADWFARVAARGWAACCALSMEMVNPPAGFAALYPDQTPVETETGLGDLKSTHCAFAPAVAALQKALYAELAALMETAGLTAWLQFGEFCWWYFAKAGSGMGYYDPYTAALAYATLGRALHVFMAPTDDPAVNGYEDADFLAGRIVAQMEELRAHVLASRPLAKFEWLLPYDVNYPEPSAHGVGGRLNNHVNVPAALKAKAGSPLDRVKMEGLAFGTQERNLDKALEAARFPYAGPGMSWAKADSRYLMPWNEAGCPWALERWRLLREQTPHVNAWAYDQLCLMDWPVPPPAEPPRALLR